VTWTNTPPTRPGSYWWRPRPGDFCRTILVMRSRDGILHASLWPPLGLQGDGALLWPDCQWSDVPAELPEEPTP